MAVYTIGYEGRSLDDLLSVLRSADVQLLADVREAPISRKRGFAKSALSQALVAAGIDYVHLRALGCPKAIRDAHKHDGDWGRYTRDFMAYLATQSSGIDELAQLTLSRRTALLCYEANFNRCHRTYVARAVVERTGAMLRHIAGAGIVEEDAAALQ